MRRTRAPSTAVTPLPASRSVSSSTARKAGRTPSPIRYRATIRATAHYATKVEVELGASAAVARALPVPRHLRAPGGLSQSSGGCVSSTSNRQRCTGRATNSAAGSGSSGSSASYGASHQVMTRTRSCGRAEESRGAGATGHGPRPRPGQQFVAPALGGPGLPHQRDGHEYRFSLLTSCTWSWSWRGVRVRLAGHVRLGHRQRGVRRQLPVRGGPVARHHLRAERRDHRAVVRAQLRAAAPAAGSRPARSAPAASARSRELAATPPPIIRWSTPSSLQARTALRVSTSTTASWKDAGDVAHRHLLARAPLRLDPAGHRGLQAGEGEVVRRVARTGQTARERDRRRVALARAAGR